MGFVGKKMKNGNTFISLSLSIKISIFYPYSLIFKITEEGTLELVTCP